MLSLSSSMQSQVFLPLSYVVSQFSSARKSSGRTSHKVKLEQRNKELNSKPEVACSIRNSNLVQDVRSAVDPSMLRQFALTGSLSQEQRLNPHISDSKTPWKVSHSSSFSFADNKNGFSSQPTSEIVTLTLSRKLLRQFQSSHLFYDSRRGFKTRQAIEKNLFEQQPLASRFKQSLKLKETGQVDAETKLKLGSLLREDGVEDPQKKIKLAFAEGYLAAEPNKKHTSKFMKFIQNIQNFVIFLTVVSLLFLVWGGLGGSMFRMHVGNGGEVHPEEIKVTFNDVKGVDEAKLELQEIVSFLKNPQKFKSLGAELPKGVLLVGPPGTGKTLLARAVAGEAGVPFFHAAGPEFDEILVGQGARRVRDLFQAAKLRAPCVIFIDEIDSVGAKRTNSVLHPYANQTINQLLSEMDGFHENEGVIILGATNRRDDLDKALLRPGRFDVEVQVPVPDLAGRKEIFDYYLGKIHYGNDVDVSTLGRGTTGFTGADIKNVVNQAALRAAADLLESVTMKYMEEARDKVLMGPERKSRIPDEEVNVITAYHEGGHAIVSYFTKHSCSLHKVTIIPRGPSLGHTAYIPEKEQYHRTRGEMLANMDSLMGGRVAEELIFGPEQLTSGSYSDLKRATLIATQMVKDFGMSDKVGLRTFEDTSNQLLKSGDSLSQTTKEAIDTEIKKLLNDSYERAKAILKAKSKEHKDLAEALLKYETLDAKDVKSILEGKSIRKT